MMDSPTLFLIALGTIIMIIVKTSSDSKYIMPEMKPEIKAEWIKRIKNNTVRGATVLEILDRLYHDRVGEYKEVTLVNGFPNFAVRQWCGLPMDVAINLYNMTNVDKLMLVQIASYLERDVHL